MPKPRDHVRKILDWEELESAPNTHGALSFLKSAAEIVSIRKNDDLKTLAPSNPTPGVRKLSAKKHKPNPKPCFLAQDGHSLGEAALYQVLWARAKPDADDSRIITAGWRTMKRFCGMTDKELQTKRYGVSRKACHRGSWCREHRHVHRPDVSHPLVRDYPGPTQSGRTRMGIARQEQALRPERWLSTDQQQPTGKLSDHSG